MTAQPTRDQPMTNHDRMNYWWRRATQAETRIQEVRAILDQHHDQTADALWLDINDHIPGGDLGDPDMPCGRGVCALGDGHPGPCRC